MTSDLKWSANTDFICKKAFKKMWTIRRMKVLNIEPLLILDVYLKEIRAVLELAVRAWHSGLTVKQSSDIERVQRIALHIILSDHRTGECEFSYNMLLVIFDLEPLYVRREQLCMSFAKKLTSPGTVKCSRRLHTCMTQDRLDTLIRNITLIPKDASSLH